MTCGCPIAARDGHDFPRLIDKRVPAVGAVIDDVVEGVENSVRQYAPGDGRLAEVSCRRTNGVMAVPHAILLLAVGRAHARIHVEHDAAGRSSAMHKVDPLARQVGKSSEVLRVCPKTSGGITKFSEHEAD